jgi:hypothetical protein
VPSTPVGCRSPENEFLVAAKKLANSRQGAESQLETALFLINSSDKPSGTSRAAATEVQQLAWRWFNLEQCPGHSQDNLANAPQDIMQETPQDEAYLSRTTYIFESDNVLHEELVSLGREESMYSLSLASSILI